MSTATDHIDPASRYWAENDGKASTETRYEETQECAEDDARAAFREVKERAEREAEIGADDVDALSRGFGGLKPALEYSVGMSRYLKADPVAAREKLYRDFASRPPRIEPEPAPRATPPEDITEQARIEFERLEDVRQAMRAVPRDAERKRQLDELKELLAAAAAEFRTTPGQLLQQAAGIHQALEINPGHVATKVSRWHGAPVNESHATDIAVQAHEQQEGQRMRAWLDEVERSGQLPGFQHQEVKSAMAEVIRHPNFPTTDSLEQDLVNAYSYVAAEAREYAAREYAVQQQKEHAEKARHASRSISGSPGNDVSESDVGGGSIEDDVRRALHSSSV